MMYRRCVTETAASRQQKIEECLLANMAVIPYSEISVTLLCQQSDISRKAFYRYYSSKDACLCALLDRTLMDCRLFEVSGEKVLSETPQEISSFLAFWREKKEFLDILIHNDLVDKLFSRTIQYVVNEERHNIPEQNADDFTYDHDVQVFALSGIIALIIRWHSTGYKMSDEEMVNKMSRLLLEPLMHVDFKKKY